jgi:hypothetical protein
MRKALVIFAAMVLMIGIGVGRSSIAVAQDEASHPAHIHSGSCAELGDVVAPLSDVSAQALNNGTPMAADMVGSASAIPVHSSITTVELALTDIVGGEHAINVHESAENIGNYVACGDIGGMMMGESDLLFGIAELNGSGLSGVGSLHDNGDGTTTVYVYLTMSSGSSATPVGGDMDGMDMGTPEA